MICIKVASLVKVLGLLRTRLIKSQGTEYNLPRSSNTLGACMKAGKIFWPKRC